MKNSQNQAKIEITQNKHIGPFQNLKIRDQQTI